MTLFNVHINKLTEGRLLQRRIAWFTLLQEIIVTTQFRLLQEITATTQFG
jgi:hypothetical protein